MDEERAGAPSYEELAELVAAQAAAIKSQAEEIERLKSRVAELERRLGQNSGNSGLPSSRDPVAERKRQAEEKKRRSEAARSPKRRRGKQPGSKGTTLELSEDPDEIIDHRPERCGDCGSALKASDDRGYQRRQVIDLPEVKPKVTEHRAHTYGCSCGCDTTAAFPEAVRSPVSYGPLPSCRGLPAGPSAHPEPPGGRSHGRPVRLGDSRRARSTRSTPRRAGASRSSSSPSSRC